MEKEPENPSCSTGVKGVKTNKVLYKAFLAVGLGMVVAGILVEVF